MKAKLALNTEIDILSGPEFEAGVGRLEDIWRERATGLRHMRIPVLQGTTTAGGNITLGSTGAAPGASQPGSPTVCGPLRGYVWKVVRISVFGLTATDTLSMYWGEPAPQRFVHNFTPAAPDFTTSRGLLLKADDSLVFQASGITANELLTVNGEVIEAPAEMIYKLIG